MKHKSIFTSLTAAVLAGLLATGSLGCLVTGFGLPLEHPNGLYLLCAGSAILFSLLFCLKWGTAIAACLSAFLAGWLWHRGIFLEQLLSLMVRISKVYHDAYHWGYFLFAEGDHAADLPLLVLGGLIAMAAVFSLVRGKGLILPLTLSALPLAACMVVTDTVPDSLPLFLYLSGFLLSMVPQSVRREDPAQGCRLTWLLSLPIVLALAGLFLVVPKENYVNRSEHIQAAILNTLAQIPQLAREKAAQLSSGLPENEPQELNLKALGPRPRYTHAVMEVTADTSGILYLRGQDYDLYSGTGWTASPHRLESFGGASAASIQVRISTRGEKEVFYLPYYPAEETALAGGSLKNPQGEREYSLSCSPLPENWQDTLSAQEDTGGTLVEHTPLEVEQLGSTADRLRYLTLPGQTKIAAQEILRSILPQDANRWETAEAIADYVRSSAEYDLNTSRMPTDAQDFALWFLENGETGYCVHFATAAVVLLRAADIPARYVTGYLTQVQSGETTTVTAGDAHAWAEYYVPQLETWVVLEATPTEEILREVPTPSLAPEATEALPATTEGLPPETTLPGTAPESPTLPMESQAEPEQRTQAGFSLIPVVLGLLVWLQRRLRLRLRARKFTSGSANRRALVRWQEAHRLAKLLKTTPPESLHRLAQKAKFSQHILTEEELDPFDAYLAHCHRELKAKPWYQQLAYRWVFVVY